MSASAIAGARANLPLVEAGPSRTHSGAIIETFAEIFQTHARKALMRLLRLSEGGAKKKLDGDRQLSLDEFCALLHTDDGFQYLTAVMADSRVKWWRICAPLMDAADAQAMQVAARRKITRVFKEAMDADADLTAARARADALLVHDADHYREHADALGAMAGLRNRAVAPARRR